MRRHVDVVVGGGRRVGGAVGALALVPTTVDANFKRNCGRGDSVGVLATSASVCKCVTHGERGKDLAEVRSVQHGARRNLRRGYWHA